MSDTVHKNTYNVKTGVDRALRESLLEIPFLW